MLIGIDIGGTKSACLLGDDGGSVIKRHVWPTRAGRGPEAVIRDIVHYSRMLMAEGSIRSAGVAVGGPLDARTGRILGPPNLPGWNDIPLASILGEKLGVPVCVHHDATACALAEAKWGAGCGAESVAYLTLGTGFGLGLAIQGRAYYGSEGSPPDIGHIRLTDDGPVGYGVSGSAEGWCSSPALSKIAEFRYPKRWDSSQTVSTKQICKLSNEGDEDARAVVAEHAAMVGKVCAIVADILHPNVITLGSLARRVGEPWLKEVQNSYLRNVFLPTSAFTNVTPAGLADRVQDMSALAAALAV